MKQYESIILSIILFLLSATVARGATPLCHTDSVSINFRQSKWNLDRAVGANAAALDSIDRRLSTVLNDSVYRLRSVRVFGGASPEGPVEFNKFLSEQRAATLFRWFDEHNPLDSAIEKEFTYFGRDWQGVLRLARQDPNLPYRDETLALLAAIASEKERLGAEPPRSLQRIKALRGGEPYRYLYRNIFPAVRASKVIINYDRTVAPESMRAVTETRMKRDTVRIERVIVVRDTIYIDTCDK